MDSPTLDLPTRPHLDRIPDVDHHIPQRYVSYPTSFPHHRHVPDLIDLFFLRHSNLIHLWWLTNRDNPPLATT
jgi:hypothetical protein